MERKKFSRLSSLCFEHPADKAALKALKNTAGFDRLVRFVMGMGFEPIMDYQNRSNFVRCDEKQAPDLYKLYREAVDILDITPTPPLYLAHHYAVNAWTFGSKKPYVVVTSALVEGFTDDEVQCVMGHELGHILAGHSLYRTVGSILVSLLRIGMSLAGGLVALPAWLLSRGLLSALFYWIRCSELTADRAGMLVTQRPEITYSTEMKLASGPGAKVAAQLNVERFLEQAREFETDPNLNSKLLRFVMEDGKTHPFPVVRVRELELWVESGGFQKIIDGEFTKKPHANIASGKNPVPLDEVSKAVEDVVLTSLSRVFGVYTAPKIPETTLLEAVDKYASCDENEAVVAVYEGSMGASKGVALTTKKVYSSEMPKLGIPYDRLKQIEPIAGGLFRSPAISINNGELKLAFHRAEIRDGMLDALRAARRVVQDASEDVDEEQ